MHASTQAQPASKTIAMNKESLPVRFRNSGAARSAWLAVAIVGMLLIGSTPAGAATGRTVLILSIAESGRQHDSLRTQVGELVQRAGAKLVEAEALPSSARSCDEPTCLGKLAEEYRAELILAARIERRSRHDRFVSMWIYEARSGQDQSGQELCDARDLKDCLTGLAGKLIGAQLEGSPPSAASEPPPSGTAAAASPQPAAPAVSVPLSVSAASSPPRSDKGRAGRERLPSWRIGLAVGLGALATGALVTAIAASAMHGREKSGDFCKSKGLELGCAYDLTRVFAPSYAAAGVLAAGAVLSFALPAARSPRKETR